MLTGGAAAGLTSVFCQLIAEVVEPLVVSAPVKVVAQ